MSDGVNCALEISNWWNFMEADYFHRRLFFFRLLLAFQLWFSYFPVFPSIDLRLLGVIVQSWKNTGKVLLFNRHFLTLTGQFTGVTKLANQITVWYEQWIIPKCWVLTVVFRLLVIGSIGCGWNSLFLICNLFGQFCLSDPGNSNRTVIFYSDFGISDIPKSE